VILFFDPKASLLHDSEGRVFEPASRTWRADGEVPAAAETLTPVQAVTRLQSTTSRCRVPVAVVGAREARPDQLAAAEALGRRLGGMGLTVLCGGRQGVMEATCRGVAAAGGISVGVLPDDDASAANPFVTVPIATGIGIARNAIVARAALCLVAVGGGYGTISEVAFALQFGRPVLTLLDGPVLAGARPCAGIDQAAEGVARVVLGLGPDQ
jgi:uncharacterized protein (TIGR00725 family)